MGLRWIAALVSLAACACGGLTEGPPAPDTGEAGARRGEGDAAAWGSCHAAGLQVVTLASGRDRPFGIAVDGTSVYWTEGRDAGAVMKAPLAGGEATTLAVASVPAGIAVDGANVYWSESGGIGRVSLDGGPVARLVSFSPGGNAQPTADLALFEGSVYFTVADPGVVGRVAADGGVPVTLVSPGFTSDVGGDFAPGPIAVNAGGVYFAQGASVGPVARLPMDGGAPEVRAGWGDNVGIGTDRGVIFWTSVSGGLCQIGPDLATIVYGGGAGAGLALRGDDLYWGDLADHAVVHALLASGAAVTVACGYDAWGIALDATRVYWTDQREGRVMKAAR